MFKNYSVAEWRRQQYSYGESRFAFIVRLDDDLLQLKDLVTAHWTGKRTQIVSIIGTGARR